MIERSSRPDTTWRISTSNWGIVWAADSMEPASLAAYSGHALRTAVYGEDGGDASVTCSLKDLRAFAVRQRLDVTFHDRTTGAAWMVNRRGLVAWPAMGDTTIRRVEDTLEAADEFLLEGDRQPPRRLSREQFLELMATRAAATGAARDKDDE